MGAKGLLLCRSELKRGKMLRVVILDDNVPIRELLAEWLSGAGHLVLDPHTLPMAQSPEIDVVLIDLPNLREGARSAIAPLRLRFARAQRVGLSTHLGESLPQRSAVARSLGLFAVLAKPCSRTELLGVIRALDLP